MSVDPASWPIWLRWLAFLPLAAAAHFLFELLAGAVVGLFNEDSAMHVAGRIAAGFAAGAMLVVAGAYVAPQARLACAILLTALLLVGCVVAAIFAPLPPRAAVIWVHWAVLACRVAGAVAAILLVRSSLGDRLPGG